MKYGYSIKMYRNVIAFWMLYNNEHVITEVWMYR